MCDPQLLGITQTHYERSNALYKDTQIHDIPLHLIDDFPDHPYKVQNNDDMYLLAESIRNHGVITPAVVRKKEEGRYEMISGHRRMYACGLAGLDTIRCRVVDVSREEAILMMVNANCQRANILPSEKAYAYKMKLDALNHQGQTYGQVGHKSRDSISQTDSGRQVQRYIRLTHLIKPLLQLVDEKQIALSPAVEISYLTEDEQYDLLEAIEQEVCTPSHAQAIRMRKLSSEGRLFTEDIFEIMAEEKPNQVERIRIPLKDLQPYFAPWTPPNKMIDTIIKAMEYYQRHQERQRFDIERS